MKWKFDKLTLTEFSIVRGLNRKYNSCKMMSNFRGLKVRLAKEVHPALEVIR